MEVLTGQQMRNVDRRAIEGMGIPSLLLMESAGAGITRALVEDYPDLHARSVVIVCGRGNNGGDGLVVARHLLRLGVSVRVALLGRASGVKGDAAVNLAAARSSGVGVDEIDGPGAWTDFRSGWPDDPIVVDAILGTGVRGGARGLAGEVIEQLNKSKAHVVSVDLPSGLNADLTHLDGSAVIAERTYTLCRPKLALVIEPTAHLAGTWRVVPIGIPDSAIQQEAPLLEWVDATVARRLLPRRPAESNKGTFGHLLAVAGSAGKSGAAILVARGALRSGAGLVTVATPSSNQERVAVQQAEVMTEALAETSTGALARGASARALALLAERDALVLGPGLGTEAETRAAALSIVGRRTAPAVIDADGLNAFALGGKRSLARLKAGRQPLVLTPHPGEASRLLGSQTKEIQADRLDAASRLARNTDAIVVLKGHRTLTAAPDGRLAVNSSGNPGMATAGTGDVLAGMIGALLARGLSAWDASRLAVYAHGVAGDLAARRTGEDGMIAGDLVDEIPSALHALSAPEEDRPW